MAQGFAPATLSAPQLAARWRELLADAGAPERCELDRNGDLIVMNPPSKVHQRIVRALMQQLETQLGGEALPGIGILTPIGVRVPDVCWQQQVTPEDPASPAPEICVEVQSDANTRRELDAKVAAYLQAGCHEVIVVETTGRFRYFDQAGERGTSAHGLDLKLPAATYPR